MKTSLSLISAGAIVASLTVSPLCAVYASAGTSGGLTLIDAPGARAAALGEAFSAASDDVTAAAYNPAALATLSGPQVSFTYHDGISDDSSGRVDAGIRNLGISVNYYSAGSVDLLEGGQIRTVNAQSDIAVSVGTAHRFGVADVGVAAKYLSSQLAQTDHATAWAGDAGVQLPFRFARVSAAVQNIGTKLTYISDGDRLPRIARAGLEVPVQLARIGFSVHLEAPYFMNEKELRPAIGLEVTTGPIRLRAGYRSQTELEGLTLGTGFSFGPLSIDYAFGFVIDLQSRQRVSVIYRFGEAR